MLRPHSWAAEMRFMLTQKPSIRVILRLRTYIIDSVQTHTPIIHQLEGLTHVDRHQLGQTDRVLFAFATALVDLQEAMIQYEDRLLVEMMPQGWGWWPSLSAKRGRI